MGGAEVYRNTELDPEKRLYPGEAPASRPAAAPQPPAATATAHQLLSAALSQLPAPAPARSNTVACRWLLTPPPLLLLLRAPPPGGPFDPLNLAGGDDADKTFRLKTAEIKHGRLAMVSFLGEAGWRAQGGGAATLLRCWAGAAALRWLDRLPAVAAAAA